MLDWSSHLCSSETVVLSFEGEFVSFSDPCMIVLDLGVNL